MVDKKFSIPTVYLLYRSLRSIKQDWELKTSQEKWCYIYGIGRSACLIVKLPLFEDDQTLSLWAYQGFVYSGVHILLVAYTVYYYLINGDVTKCLPCTCLLVGPVIAVSLR